jgi:hypothetical protein
MHVFGKLKLSALGALAVALAAIGAGLHPACAQDAAIPGGVQILVTPYLWLSGINTTIKTPLPQEPQVSSDVSAIDLLSHLSGAPFMGSAEIRDGPFGLVGDALHVVVSSPITTRSAFFQGGKAVLTANMGTALFLYRALEEPSQFADIGAGFRSWGFSPIVNLNAGALPPATVSRSAGWGDPLFAGRYHRELGNGFGLTAYGDLGGFGVGAHVDWQLVGTIDYALNPSTNLRLGYRSLNFNYQASGGLGLGFNVHMKGPILAATFRF